MSKDELIKILEEYKMFVDDDFGGSYESIIAYSPNKTISRAHTPIAVLNIIDTFEKIQQENQKYKKVIDKLRKKCNIKKSKYDYELWLKFNESWKTLNYFAEHIKHNLHPIIINAYQWEIKNSIKEIMKLTKHDVVLKEDILNILKEVE